MKNTLKTFGIIAMVAVIGFSMAACDGGGDNGNEPYITLSGTISVPDNIGVEYVSILIQSVDNDWQINENNNFKITGKTQWSIKTKPLSESKEISFQVYASDSNYNQIFAVGVQGLLKTIHNQDIPDIDIDLKNLKLITLGGTISISYNGSPIPSIDLQIYNKDPFYKIGSTWIINAGNKSPWSTRVVTTDVNTEIVFGVFGFNSTTPWAEDSLFGYFSWDDPSIYISDSDKSDIELAFGEMMN